MHDPAYEPNYVGIRPSLMTFAIIDILLLFATIANAIWCMLNFNKGLKGHINTGKGPKRSKSTKKSKDDYMDMPVLSSPAQHRMEID